MTRERSNLVWLLAAVLLLVGAVWWMRAPDKNTTSATVAAPTEVVVGSKPVVAASPAHVRVLDEVVEVPRGSLLHPFRVFGQVVDAANQAPIAVAVVTLYRPSLSQVAQLDGAGDAASTVRTSDGQGRFEFASVRPGTLRVGVSAPGYVPTDLEIDASTTYPLRLALARGGHLLTGTVRDLTGGPVGQAMLTVRPVGANSKLAFHRPNWRTFSQDDGTYQIHLAAGMYEVVAGNVDYARDRAVVRIEKERVKQDFLLAPAARIEGTVRLATTGQPVAQASVYVQPQSTSLAQGLDVQAISDEEGHFVVEQVDPGAHQIYAVQGGSATSEPTVLRVAPGEQVENVELLLEEVGEIRGRVVVAGAGETGETQGVADAVVSGIAGDGNRYYVADAPSDSEGWFRISGVAPGKVTLQTVASGYRPLLSPTPVEVARGVTSVEIALDQGLRVKGKVVPAIVADIHLEMALGNQQWSQINSLQANGMAQTKSDESGAFELVGVAPAKVRIVAQTQDGKRGEQEVDLRSSVGEISIELKTPPPIRGRITDGQGHGVAGRVVMSRADDQLSILRLDSLLGLGGVASDESGNFEVLGLTKGTYELRFQDSEGLPLKLRATHGKGYKEVTLVAVSEQGAAALELVAQAQRAELSGIVVDSQGTTLPNVMVTVRPVQGNSPASAGPRVQRMLTDESGVFRFDGLSAHQGYHVQATALEIPRQVEATVQPTRDLRLTLQTSATLSLLVHQENPEDTCRVKASGPRVRVLACNRHGPTLVTDLIPGSYQVSVESNSGYDDQVVTVPSSGAKTEAFLQPWGQIAGTLVGAADGLPIADTALFVVGDETKAGKGAAFGLASAVLGTAPRSGVDGRFLLQQVRPGNVMLVVLAGANKFGSKAPGVALQVKAGETTQAGIIRVQVETAPSEQMVAARP